MGIRAGSALIHKTLKALTNRWKSTGGDLTASARQGKLDPVIGRDEEISSCHSGIEPAAPRITRC